MDTKDRHATSMETILNFDNRDVQSQWSTVWSTTDIPGMDNASGSSRYRMKGRRRLRVASLTLSALFTMHCRVSASALSGGFGIFILFLVVAVLMLANPLRHFEVYLGQWSINGPGRAFRIVPLLDGIGIAICLNAIFRAINFCVIAALAASYVIQSVSDAALPFTYCRDFDLKPYKPVSMDVTYRVLKHPMRVAGTKADLGQLYYDATRSMDQTRRNISGGKHNRQRSYFRVAKTEVCNETYPKPYPAAYSTPAYNFLYVEVAHLRPDFNLAKFNVRLVVILIGIWIVLWLTIVSEKILHRRLIWNNMPTWITIVPWIWVMFLMFVASSNIYLFSTNCDLRDVFTIGTKEVLAGITDAFDVALYIHAAGVGTELITGKGLNRYAGGHIDPLLNAENVFHSVIVLVLSILHSGGAVMCSLVDYKDPKAMTNYDVRESTIWIFAMYSKCTSMSGYSHFTSSLIYLGFTFSYITVALVLLKTALHTIFEYRVKLVFVEQVVVGALIVFCATLSMIFATNGGLVLLESIDTVLTNLATPFICLLELVAMLYVYGSNDFESDIDVAMEDNNCSSRMSIQWQTMPIMTLGMLILKITVLSSTEIPRNIMLLSLIPIVCIALALPGRAIYNVYKFLSPRRTERR